MKILKMINDERKNLFIGGKKMDMCWAQNKPYDYCSSTDECVTADKYDCLADSIDRCTADYAGCSYNSVDTCNIDYTACGSLATDRCDVDGA